MQRPIMTSVSFLRRPAEPASAEDLPICLLYTSDAADEL